MDSCVVFVNGQPFLVLSVPGIEIARLEISLQVALALFFIFPLSFLS
ncbi:DUF3956 family protein [Bacillus sp. GX]